MFVLSNLSSIISLQVSYILYCVACHHFLMQSAANFLFVFFLLPCKPKGGNVKHLLYMQGIYVMMTILTSIYWHKVTYYEIKIDFRGFWPIHKQRHHAKSENFWYNMKFPMVDQSKYGKIILFGRSDIAMGEQ